MEMQSRQPQTKAMRQLKVSDTEQSRCKCTPGSLRRGDVTMVRLLMKDEADGNTQGG